MENRPYDILILGGTGFTGEMVLEYFLRGYSKEIEKNQVRILCAARNVDKLKEILENIQKRNLDKEGKDVPIDKLDSIGVDVFDYDSLLKACSQCRIVVNTIGPFSMFGYNIVKSCVESNCHYLDICGEHTFVLKIFKEFNEIAKQKKIKIIHSASFISAISDLGTFIIQNEFLQTYQKPCEYVRVRLCDEGSHLGTVGRATIKSSVLFRKEVKGMYNKHYLCENKYEEEDVQPRTTPFVDYEKDLGYCFNTVYSKIEEAYVLWSNYLMNYKYGKNFVIDYKKYNPHIGIVKYICKKVGSSVTSFLTSLSCMDSMFLHYINSCYKPKTVEELRKAYWKVVIIGEMTQSESNHSKGNEKEEEKTLENEQKVIKKYLTMSGTNEDPGYLLTAKIISELALSILEEENKRNILSFNEEVILGNESTKPIYGVLSISVGSGNAVIERLKNTSIEMKLE